MQAGANLDADWIEASLRGDRDAFAQIIHRYHRAVNAVAFSSVRDRALADDITQDTFVTAWRRLDELRDTSRLPAWLCGIARNLGRDARKRGRREVLGEPTEPADPSTPYDDLNDAESERAIATALGEIPDVYREPLVLYYYEERSVEDVARSLGISPATTHKRLSRGRKYLADSVASIFDRGVPRGRPAHALVAGVLAAIGITAPASHVDASPLATKGSTMHKLAIAATVAATLGGAGIIAATTGDAAVRPGAPPPSAASATTSSTKAAAPAAHEHCDLASHLRAATRAAAAPSLVSPTNVSTTTAASNGPAPDCTTLGRHLAELEADTTHGAEHRPDEATCDLCASHYVKQCESEGWTAERRACAMAAGDLINAHLCAGNVPKTQPTNIPASLSCATLSAHIASTVQSAGIYADVTDMPQQIDAACEMGGWPIALRQCFASASTVSALQACIVPPAP